MSKQNEKSLDVVGFRPEYAQAFYDISAEWVESMFSLEEVDKHYLKNPQKNIIDKGGQILFAKFADELIGTVALVPHEEGRYELTKMGVLNKARGLRAGKLLLDAALDWCKNAGAKKVYLETSYKCVAAIGMYRKVGFVDVPVRDDCEYDRCELAMEMLLP